jgi:predicted transcriptional regulator of viral defense system
MLREELKEYVNPTARIRRLVAEGTLIQIVRELYETDRSIPGYYLAPVIYGPSYLSFEFALAFHALIPETVVTFTSATYEKKKAKRYETPFGTYTYRDVPSEAYPVGVVLYSEQGYGFQIASPEKALCDQLYKTSPVGSRLELEHLLYEDFRIDPEAFNDLRKSAILEIATCYHTQNLDLLRAYLERSRTRG